MKIINFSELTQLDLNLEYLSASRTLDVPHRNFRCPLGMRPFDRFFYVEHGEFHITQDGFETLTVHPGELLYLPSNCVYSSEWTSEEIEYCSVEFVLSDKDDKLTLSERIFLTHADRTGVILELMHKILTIRTRGEVGYKLKSMSLFFELLHHIALAEIKRDLGEHHGDISAAIIQLENNYVDDINANELAKLCGMCESSFRQRFQAYAGMPPIKYRNMLRARKAAELLSSGEYTVREAAELVGIPDVAYFNRVFRTFMGDNPSNFIEKQRRKNNTIL